MYLDESQIRDRYPELVRILGALGGRLLSSKENVDDPNRIGRAGFMLILPHKVTQFIIDAIDEPSLAFGGEDVDYNVAQALGVNKNFGWFTFKNYDQIRIHSDGKSLPAFVENPLKVVLKNSDGEVGLGNDFIRGGVPFIGTPYWYLANGDGSLVTIKELRNIAKKSAKPSEDLLFVFADKRNTTLDELENFVRAALRRFSFHNSRFAMERNSSPQSGRRGSWKNLQELGASTALPDDDEDDFPTKEQEMQNLQKLGSSIPLPDPYYDYDSLEEVGSRRHSESNLSDVLQMVLKRLDNIIENTPEPDIPEEIQGVVKVALVQGLPVEKVVEVVAAQGMSPTSAVITVADAVQDLKKINPDKVNQSLADLKNTMNSSQTKTVVKQAIAEAVKEGVPAKKVIEVAVSSGVNPKAALDVVKDAVKELSEQARNPRFVSPYFGRKSSYRKSSPRKKSYKKSPRKKKSKSKPKSRTKSRSKSPKKRSRSNMRPKRSGR